MATPAAVDLGQVAIERLPDGRWALSAELLSQLHDQTLQCQAALQRCRAGLP